MKKFVNKLMAGMLAFAMTVSAPMSAMAAPENTEAAPVSEGEITLSQEAETTLAAAKALSSLNENYGDSEDGQDNAKSVVKNAIFSNYNDSTDLSRYNISSDEMDSMLDEILGEKNITSTVAVTYETDAEGDVTTTEVEMDPMVVMAAEELEENKTVYNLTEEQTQELLGMYAQYLQLYQDNADIFGVQVPYNTTRDTNSSPIGSLLDIASIPDEYAQAGGIGYDVLSGIIQLYLLGTNFIVQNDDYRNQIIEARDAALAAMAPATSEMQEYLLLNDWLANNCQFAMDYIMDEMVQPEPTENQLYTYAYKCMYNMIRQQVYDATYDVMVNQYGMPEDMAKGQADSVADAYMVDVQEDGGSGAQQAASTASSIVGMWGSNQVGVFIGKKAVCFGYASVYAYLLQCAHPEIYLKDGTDDINVAENWKSYTELNYELDGDGNPVKDDKGDYVWSADAPAMVDYVKIIFDADATMFGKTAPFGEAHYWNAVKLDGQWYYVDPCYVDIYVECMNRDRVETDGNLNHLYFMFSDTSCREMYDGNIQTDEEGNVIGLRTLYENIATDTTYEDAWVAFIKSQPYKVDDRTYYFYDSTDLLDIMRQDFDSSAAADSNSDYESMFTDAEYKIVYHTDAQRDASADFETLIDFNNGQVYNPKSEMLEDNALISELYAEHQEYVKEYPSIMISCAYYEGKIYFSLSNCILSYDLETGAVTKLIEYTEVSGERDMSNGLGGLGFTMTSGDPGTNGITVQNPPIADMTIKSDGKMYVSVATNYGFISGKAFGQLTDYSSYGYQFAESNYNPAYNTYYNNDEPNDNDEFMWSANIVGTIEMSHLEGTGHSYTSVTVPASCTEDEYTVSRCSTCGLLEETEEPENPEETGEEPENPEETGEKTEVEETTIEEIIEDENNADTVNADESTESEPETLEATLKIAVYDEDAEAGSEPLVDPVTLTANGEEGNTHTFIVSDIEEAAKKILPENYILDGSSLPEADVEVAYGDEKTVDLKASKEQAIAKLDIKVYDAAKMPEEGDEDAAMPDPVYETSIEKTGNKGESCTFTVDEIKEAVDTEELEEIGYTLNEDSIEEVSTTFGAKETATAELTATEISKGKGHRYVKFDETYYTKDGEAWQTGTSYSCIDCGHAFEVDEDSVVDDYLRSNDTVLTDEEVAAYASDQTKVWTWSTDKTEASMYSVPTELMDHKFDSVWENPAWSSREVATVEGDCTTGVFTATLSNGETDTANVDAGNHSYLNQEEKDNAGQVTQEAAVQWTWEEDLSKATATFKCDVCGKTYTPDGVAQKDMQSSETAATCTEAASTKYTATVNVDGVNYISSRQIETGAALGHDYGDAKPEWTWADDFSTATATLTCKVDGHEEVVEATVTKESTGSTSCDEIVIYTATAEINGKEYTDKQEKKGSHEYEAEFTWNSATDEDAEVPYTATVVLTCKECEDKVTDVPVTVTLNKEASKAATCEEEGTNVYTATATYDNEPYNDEKKDTVPALGHELKGEFTWEDVKDDAGETTYEAKATSVKVTCTHGCGTEFTADDPTTVKDEENSKEPTRTEAGVNVFVATAVVKDKDSQEIGTVTETKEVNIPALGNPFVDVSENEYYYNAVLWAYDNGITEGTDATHFSPDNGCSRAQVVTFLWRAMGKPEVKTTNNPFEDVSENEYYYTAVLWAYENGITTGIDETHFAPARGVSRAEFVTFLHRNEGEPKPKAETNPFEDVVEGEYYYDAVLWAYENGITTGADETHFAPKKSCLRGQVVTFLYRAYGETK